MHGTTCIFWANLTPFSLQLQSAIAAACAADCAACDVNGVRLMLGACAAGSRTCLHVGQQVDHTSPSGVSYTLSCPTY